MKSNNKAKLDDLKVGGALFVTVLSPLQAVRIIILGTF